MNDELVIFISSKMVELAKERQLLYDHIPKIGGTVKPWAYERDAVASNKTIRDVYLNELKNSWLYIGIFWNDYGEWTIDEFLEAEKEGIPRLLFVKDVDTENRDERLTEFINKQQGVTTGIAPKWFKTSEELLESIEKSIRTLLNERVFRPSSPAELITDPDILIAKHYSPRRFIGRQDLIQQAQTGLTNTGVILLQGLSGMGKTALAGHLAVELLEQKFQSKLVWMRVGNDPISILYEQLAHAFNAQEAIAKAQTDAERQQILRNLLKNIDLLILDDAWNGKSLFELIQVLPRNTALIVTSRQYFPLDGAKISLDSLSSEDALAMLGYYADLDFTSNQEAAELCELLGNHTYALEIAGRTLADPSLKLTPQDLTDKIKHNPSEMTMPGDFVEEGRENIKKLLDVSFNALDENAQRIFLTFGAMFAPSATPELLSIFRPKHKDNILVILKILEERGLVTYIPDTEEAVSYYQVHDLAHSYARNQIEDDELSVTLYACLVYAHRYNEPSLSNFQSLHPELNNLLRAAEWAYSRAYFAEVEDFAWQLYRGSEILIYRGFYTQALSLLKNAALAAEKQNNLHNQGAHLGNLGNVYTELGQYEQAIEYLTRVLEIFREMGNRQGEGSALGSLGNVYVKLGQYEQAIEYLTQVLEIFREMGNRQGEGSALGNLGSTYRLLGQYEQAIKHHTQALTISREIGDKRGEGNDLSNLGIAYRYLGQYGKAIEYYTQALTISREMGNKLAVGVILGNLGNIYQLWGQYEQAIEYYTQALTIHQEIGNRKSEGADLGNLGVAYQSLGQYEQAINYHTRALAIRQEIGDKAGEGNDLGNLGIVYENLGQYELAIEYHTQALTISRKIGNRNGEGSASGNLGIVYKNLGQYDKAIEYYNQTLIISREIGDRRSEGNSCNNIAVVYEDQENYVEALLWYEKALAIREAIEVPHMIEKTKERIENVKRKMAGSESAE